MSPIAYLLVVLSALTHAYWNFLLKRSGGTQVMVGLSKLVEGILFAPLLVLGTSNPERLAHAWVLPVVGAILVLINYVLLSAAYRRGDLSLVYPVARGAMLVFLPPLAYLTIGERLNVTGWVALTVIVLGIVMLQIPSFQVAGIRRWGRELRDPATLFALLAALTAACYTVWDKGAVQVLSPLTYYAAYTVLLGIAYAILLPRMATRASLYCAWRMEWRIIVQIGVFNSGSYLLALAALQTGHASYVIALRQLSIAAGAVLGAKVLGEVLPLPRRAGVLLVLAGCALLAMAR